MRLDRVLRQARLRSVLAVTAACVGVASCYAPPSPPRPVEETIPTVTYNYRSDQELVQASSAADTHCGRYNARPRTANITNNPDGSNTVVFACERLSSIAPAAAPPPMRPPSVSYTYRTDQDLVEATRTADAYCMNYNAKPSPARISRNADGSRVVMFDCTSPR